MSAAKTKIGSEFAALNPVLWALSTKDSDKFKASQDGRMLG